MKADQMGNIVPPEKRLPETLQQLQEKIRAGEYDISEHVVRFILFGKITVSEIEKTVIDGMIVEVRVNRRKQECWLVKGRAEGKVFLVLCTTTPDGRMVILLTLGDGPLKWRELGWTQVPKGENMSDSLGKCFFCGGNIKPVVVGNFDYRLEGDLYVVKNVPAGLCLECGEKYVSADTAKKINALVAAGKFSGSKSVQVIDYQ